MYNISYFILLKMEFNNFIKNSNITKDNPSLQQELDKIDDLIDTRFQSRKDNSLKNDKKIINNIKLYFFHDNFDLANEKKQKQINKLLSIIGNYKKDNKKCFKPLIEPKKVSLIGKIFVNNDEINSNIKNNNELNIEKNKDFCNDILN